MCLWSGQLFRQSTMIKGAQNDRYFIPQTRRETIHANKQTSNNRLSKRRLDFMKDWPRKSILKKSIFGDLQPQVASFLEKNNKIAYLIVVLH
mmetsp:Transcript_912/g.2378  ORF Transcript_912/g.2378 Transcript_912/m.2378 type:complete len:92 (-) Transcript_912:455-730(-)